MTRSAVCALAGLAAGLGGLTGCGKPTPPAPAAVRGTVTFLGRPLAGGLIVFAPDREKGNAGRPLSAAIGPDGGYHLSVDGATRVTPGWYRVAIADPPRDSAADDTGPRFPPALRRPDRAGLDREVRPGRENVLHFHIEVPE